MKAFHVYHLYQSFKMIASKNMCTVMSQPNLIPEHICNLAKELNVKNEVLAKIINNHQKNLKLHNKSQWLTLFQYLCQYDFKTSELLEIVDSHPDILNVNRKNLHKCMFAWSNFRFDDKKLRQLIISQPSCLLLDDKQILSRIPKLLAYVGNKHNRLLELISYSPNILFDNWNHLETKFDYILLDMELGPTQFVNTSVMSSTLFDIKCRHNFLVKLGMYKKRDPKSNRSQMNSNPSLKKIIETNDKQFAIKVAGVTAEEFYVFKMLFKKEFCEENEEDLDENDYVVNNN